MGNSAATAKGIPPTEACSFPPKSTVDLLQLFNLCPLGIAACDREGIYLFANPAYARIYGYAPHELIGRNFMDIKTPPERREVQRELLQKLLAEQPQNVCFEKTDMRRDGAKIDVRYRIDFLRDPSGAVYGSIVCVEDVSEQNRVLAENKELESRLAQAEKLESIGRLAAGVAHDFNNRLAVILGLADELKEKMDDEKRADDADNLGCILKAGRQAADLTKHLLAFSRQGSHPNVTVNLHQIILDVLDLLERSADKRISLRRSLKASHPYVMGDPSTLQNMVLNLAVNACQAMQEGGTLEIRTDTITESAAAIFPASLGLAKREYVRISVIDTGIGMSEETRKQIFDPFFTTKKNQGGTGLGLSAVHGGTKLHNGAIDLISEPGKGTRFDLYLPCCISSTSEQANEADLSLPTGKIALLIDDEADVLHTIEQMLKRLGVEALAYNDINQAVDYYRRNHRDIDIIILDMMLPGMTGLDVLDKLQKIEPKAKVILSSGYSTERMMQVALERGVLGYLSKPYDAAALGRKIMEALG